MLTLNFVENLNMLLRRLFTHKTKRMNSIITHVTFIKLNTIRINFSSHYTIFWLEKNTVSTVNFFYYNDLLSTIVSFIVLLEQTYDDASHEYTAMIKLETFWQRNHEFTSFFLKFFSLVDELNWNESAKIVTLWHAISDEIHAQFMI